MSARPSLDDYVDVALRIDNFIAKYPEGSLQTIDWEVRDVAGQSFVVYRAAAYRTPSDKRPGMGIAWEPFPGLTPYTKNSELMNAETAAWGRAIVAVGLASNKKIASRQEVRARQAEQEAAEETPKQNENGAAPRKLNEDERGRVLAAIDASGQKRELVFAAVGMSEAEDLNVEHAQKIHGLLQQKAAA